MILLLATMVVGACQKKSEATFETDIEKVSYAYGINVGKTLKQRGMTEINYITFKEGLKDGLQGNEFRMTQEEIQQTISDYTKKTADDRRKMLNELAETNLKESQEYLKKNRIKEGVKVTESGLQYKLIEEGTGASPDMYDQVKVHYRGELADGTEFDSSYQRGGPATFPVSGIIQGWAEGLQLMKEGATYEFFIPPNLAYGERGGGRSIGPNEMLIFEVKLLEVIKQQGE